MNQAIGGFGGYGATPNPTSKTSVSVPVVRLDASTGQVIQGWGTGISRRPEDVSAGVAVRVQTPAGGWVRAEVPQGSGSAIAAAAGFVQLASGGYRLASAPTGTQGASLADSIVSNLTGGSTDINGGGDAYSVMRGPSTGLVNASGSKVTEESSGPGMLTYLMYAAVVTGVGYLGYRWYKGGKKGSGKSAASRVKRAMKRFR